jgi:hypothetical protein
VTRTSEAPDTAKPPYSEGTEIGRRYAYKFSSACTHQALAVDGLFFDVDPSNALLPYFWTEPRLPPGGKWIVASLVLTDRSTAELDVGGETIVLHLAPIGELALSCS